MSFAENTGHLILTSPKAQSMTLSFACVVLQVWLGVQLHCSHKRHNKTVRTDSIQGSRNQKHYCLCQRLHWNRHDWNVISPTVWHQQSEFLLSRQSGQTPAAVRIGVECRCNVAISMDTHVGLNVATRVCDVYPHKCWFAVLCRFWLQCRHTLRLMGPCKFAGFTQYCWWGICSSGMWCITGPWYPWRWDHYTVPQGMEPNTKLHRITFQKAHSSLWRLFIYTQSDTTFNICPVTRETMPFFQQNRETGHTANNLMLDPEVKANTTPCNSGTTCPVTQHHIPKDTNLLQHCYKNI